MKCSPGRLDIGQHEVMKAVGWHGQGGAMDPVAMAHVPVCSSEVPKISTSKTSAKVAMVHVPAEGSSGESSGCTPARDGEDIVRVVPHYSGCKVMMWHYQIVDIVDITCQRSIGFLSI